MTPDSDRRMLTETPIFAKEFLHPSGILLDGAELLAGAVVTNLSQSEQVSIEMAGTPAKSGSYFNVVPRRTLIS